MIAIAVDDDDGDSCPGCVRKERQSGVDPAQVQQQLVDSTFLLEHGTDDQQGNELGHGDGQGQDRTPHTLQAGGGAVDDHGHDGAGEEVQEGCEEGPDQGPTQNREELSAQRRGLIKQGNEVFQTNPVEQGQVVTNTGVVGECHQHHVHQGNHGEDHEHGEGEEHQQLVNVLIEQSLDVVGEGLDTLASLLGGIADVGAADGCTPDNEEYAHSNQGCHSIKQDLLGVVALDVLIDALSLVPNFLGDAVAQAGHQTEPVETAAVGKDHIADESNFNQQEDQALDVLAHCEVASAHDQAGQPDHSIAVFQRVDQTVGIQLLLAGCCGLG